MPKASDYHFTGQESTAVEAIIRHDKRPGEAVYEVVRATTNKCLSDPEEVWQ